MEWLFIVLVLAVIMAVVVAIIVLAVNSQNSVITRPPITSTEQMIAVMQNMMTPIILTDPNFVGAVSWYQVFKTYPPTQVRPAIIGTDPVIDALIPIGSIFSSIVIPVFTISIIPPFPIVLDYTWTVYVALTPTYDFYIIEFAPFSHGTKQLLGWQTTQDIGTFVSSFSATFSGLGPPINTAIIATSVPPATNSGTIVTTGLGNVYTSIPISQTTNNYFLYTNGNFYLL